MKALRYHDEKEDKHFCSHFKMKPSVITSIRWYRKKAYMDTGSKLYEYNIIDLKHPIKVKAKKAISSTYRQFRELL